MENDDRTFGYPIFSRIAYNMRFFFLCVHFARDPLVAMFWVPLCERIAGFLRVQRVRVAALDPAWAAVIFDSFVFGQPMGPWAIYQGRSTIWGIYKVNTSFGESIR